MRDLAGHVLVVGDVVDDVLVQPLAPVTADSDTASTIVTRAGGSAANQAAWLGHLGVPVRFVGRVGQGDVAGHHRALTRHGVDARLAGDPCVGTGTIVVMVGRDGGRTMFTDRGANLRLTRADLPPAALEDAALLHLTGYSLFGAGVRAVSEALLAHARAHGVPVTVDPGSVTFLEELSPSRFLEITRAAAVCLPNRDEAELLTGTSRPDAMAQRLTAWYDTVVVKLGRQGCVVATRSQQPVRVPAVPATVRDTTGAGDAFAAGFLGAWLAGEPPVGAARAGSGLAAEAVRVLGGRPAACSD